MSGESLAFVFINAAVINNMVLAMFLGICPLLGVTSKTETAIKMGIATTFVMVISSVCAYGLHILLIEFHLEFLQIICYVTVIATAVQVVEMIIKKFSPTLFRALGIYLPLITTNCVVLAVALFQISKEYNFIQSLVYSIGGGVGFTLAMLLMAGLREKLDLADLPSVSRGAGLTIILAGLLSLAFMGFAGLGGSNG